MKLLVLAVVFITSKGLVNAQNINIPDPILKEYLVTRLAAANDPTGIYDIRVDANGDGEIQISEAEAIIALRIRNQDFINPEGLEHFVNLVALDLSGNEIESIDVSVYQGMRELDLGGNNLLDIDLSSLLNLMSLDLGGNELMDIDLSNNLQVEELFIAGNKMTTLITVSYTHLTLPTKA